MSRDRLLKAEAAGNDFLVGFGSWASRLGTDPDLVRELCDRRRGIGADGVLAVSLQPAGVAVEHRNADGGRSLFCANGSRCAALAARHELGCDSSMLLLTGWGPVPATVLDAGVRLELPPPAAPPRSLVLEAGGRSWNGSLLTVGVPHLVLAVDDPAAIDLATVGPVLRRHPALGPDGANVHVVGSTPAGELHLRSFERGVEDETWCCGSGVVAAGLLAMAVSGARRQVLRCRAGDRLTVTALGSAPLCASELTGPARLVAVVAPWTAGGDPGGEA